ncbi:phosphoethanolamine transferase [Rodentibacter haemolyticus]|uniref:phosphoethanolamine transferase n=1 Tax=Rodentibacter haemolyticus TaxID=2778911 RepID=UPI001E3E7533|nr:sulfatase-like hydrolase/transferase [Rodentibacter haemolyticus]
MPYIEQDLLVTQDKPDPYRHITVLIVGETTRAQNWGLNGYKRQTTPLLANRGEQIINFRSVSSCGTSTAYSVPCMFSTMDKDIVVVLHTIGSHEPTYHERYPAEYRRFTPTCDTNEINKCSNQELVNTYDNGILYIAQFIDKVITKLEQRNNVESAELYVSDHGESLSENGVYLHSAPYAIAPKEQTQVPMIMWFSSAFRQDEGIDFDCLRRNAKQQKYSHDNFYSTVFGVMDMSLVSDTYRPEKDILATCKKQK